MPPKETVSVAAKPSLGKKIFNKKNLLIVFLALILVLAVGAACYFYMQTIALKKAPFQSAEQELKSTIEKISRHIILPTNEVPTLATVSDPEKLKNQPFFNNAQKGDQILIYSKAKEAVLYRPSADKIISFAPVNLEASETNKNTNTPDVNGNVPAPKNQ
jgi:hypothetical protein